VRAYIDDLLIITTRGTIEDHISKIETVLTQLCDARLKVNVAKSFFCTHEIEYLGYILMRGGIKPQQNKVQAILALNQVKGGYTFVYVFEDGEWKISQHHSSVMPEGTMPKAITQEEVKNVFYL
jgi:hypothetical protein